VEPAVVVEALAEPAVRVEPQAERTLPEEVRLPEVARPAVSAWL
jgi:hypothetical protein